MLILIQTAESPTVSQNLFMFAPNAWGFVVAIWLSMAAVKLQYSVATEKTEAPAPHEKLVIGCKLWVISNIDNSHIRTHAFHFRVTVVVLWLAVVSLLSFLQVSLEQWKLVVGIVAVINTFLFYLAPLSTIVTVLKTRDSWQVYFEIWLYYYYAVGIALLM